MSNFTQSGLLGVGNPVSTPSSTFIRKVNGVNRTFIYYDPDIFNDTIILSCSLLIGEDQTPWYFHYNTTHDEDLGTSGTSWKTLEEICIPIYPKPKSTKIIGQKRMNVGDTLNYHISSPYDSNNIFTYDWFIDGNADFINAGTNSHIKLNAGKSVDINFPVIDTITLKCKISNPSGCFRWIIYNLYPGTLTKKLLVVRYPYF